MFLHPRRISVSLSLSRLTLLIQDALRQDDSISAIKNPFSTAIAPIYFVIFVLMAQFVLVNVVVAVLMKKLDVR